MSETLRLGTATAGRGETVWGVVPIPEAYHGQIEPPVIALARGVSTGPTVYIGAGAHGDEYNSMEAVRRAALALNPTTLRGTVVFVPVQNQAAFTARTRHTPADNKDLDYCYPGDPDGTPTESLAHLLLTQLAAQSDYALDLHTATRGGWNLLHALTAPSPRAAAERARELASAFGVEVIVALEAPEAGEHLGGSMGWNLDHNFFVQASQQGIPCPIIEFGEGGRLEPNQVELGFAGILNVLVRLGMVDVARPPGVTRHKQPLMARQSLAVRCSGQGFVYLHVKPGESVQREQLLARIVSFPDRIEEVRSPSSGIVVRVATDGVVVPGERIAVLTIA